MQLRDNFVSAYCRCASQRLTLIILQIPCQEMISTSIFCRNRKFYIFLYNNYIYIIYFLLISSEENCKHERKKYDGQIFRTVTDGARKNFTKLWYNTTRRKVMSLDPQIEQNINKVFAGALAAG
ncbi:MAG: hypothetical protein LDL24_06165, partial [Treponema sp.]|nr:hypothetical protein [Treponema sp.]